MVSIKKVRISIFVIACTCLLMDVIAYPFLKDSIVSHMTNGTVDAYDGKYIIFLWPLLLFPVPWCMGYRFWNQRIEIDGKYYTNYFNALTVIGIFICALGFNLYQIVCNVRDPNYQLVHYMKIFLDSSPLVVGAIILVAIISRVYYQYIRRGDMQKGIIVGLVLSIIFLGMLGAGYYRTDWYMIDGGLLLILLVFAWFYRKNIEKDKILLLFLTLVYFITVSLITIYINVETRALYGIGVTILFMLTMIWLSHDRKKKG